MNMKRAGWAVLGAVGCLLLAGAAQQPPTAPSEKTDALDAVIDAHYWRVRAEESKQIGRFHIYLSTITARDSYLLDSVTGDCWIVVNNKDKTCTMWQLMERDR